MHRKIPLSNNIIFIMFSASKENIMTILFVLLLVINNQLSNQDMSFSGCENDIIKDYFIYSGTPLAFILDEDGPVENSLLSNFVQEFSHSIYVFSINKAKEQVPVNTNYIFSINNISKFYEILDFLKTYSTFWDYHLKFLIFLEDDRVVKDIFKALTIEDVNALIISENANTGIFKMFVFKAVYCNVRNCSWNSITPHYCNNISSYTIVNNLPNKMYKCMFVNFDPYFKNLPNNTLSTTKGNYGLEFQILNLIGEKLGFVIKYVMSEIVDDYGEVFVNGTITGNFLKMKNNEADLIACAYQLQYTRCKRFHYTFAHLFDKAHWCVPYKSVQTNLNKLLKVVDDLASYLILGLICVVIAAMNFVGRNIDNDPFYKPLVNVVMKVFTVMHGVPTKLPKHRILRMMITIIIFLNMVLSIVLSSHISSQLANIQYANQYDTDDKLYNSNLELYAYRTHKDYFKDTHIYDRIKETTNSNLCLDDIIYGKNVACMKASFSRNYLLGHYNWNLSKPLLYCSKEVIAMHPLTIYMRRGFPYYKRMSEVVLSLTESGFIGYFREKQLKPFNEQQDSANFLRLNELKYIFISVFAVQFISVIVFLCEILHHKYIKSRLN